MDKPGIAPAGPRFLRSAVAGALLIVLAVINCPKIEAKIAATSLRELVKYSDLILYGETTTSHVATPEDVGYPFNWFRTTSVLKGSLPGGTLDVPLCDDRQYRDTIDLKKFPGTYVVFARAHGRCYEPVAGYKSLIPVHNGTADTYNINGEPTSRWTRFKARSAS